MTEYVDSGEQNAPIGAMPGCQRLGWRHGLIDEVDFNFITTSTIKITSLRMLTLSIHP